MEETGGFVATEEASADSGCAKSAWGDSVPLEDCPDDWEESGSPDDGELVSLLWKLLSGSMYPPDSTDCTAACVSGTVLTSSQTRMPMETVRAAISDMLITLCFMFMTLAPFNLKCRICFMVSGMKKGYNAKILERSWKKRTNACIKGK